MQPGATSQPHPTAQLVRAEALPFFASDSGNLPFQDYHSTFPALALPATDGGQVDAGASNCIQEVGAWRSNNAAIEGLEIHKIKARMIHFHPTNSDDEEASNCSFIYAPPPLVKMRPP
jgi:hypothetical protein